MNNRQEIKFIRYPGWKQRLLRYIVLHFPSSKEKMGVSVFKHYAIADGIYRVLFNKKWNGELLFDGFKDKRQLWFRFT